MKHIQDNHYLVWTDALHARELSRQANNRWDKGTYVRWTIMSCWIALEMACQDALGDNTISYSFKQNMDDAIEKLRLEKLQWGAGLWQQVSKLQKLRKNCTHRFLSESNLFPTEGEADGAVNIARDAVKDIYRRANKAAPKWIDDDYDQGWAAKGFDFYGTGFEIRQGVILGNPDNIRFAYVYKDREYTWDVYPPGTDPEPLLERMIESLARPISKAIVYRGNNILKAIEYDLTTIRGT